MKAELVMFTVVAFLVTAILILVFFRSFSTLAIAILFIAIGVIVMFGVSGFLGFFFGAIAGIMVPAALICLAPIVGYVVVCLACVFAALAVLFYGAIWLFSW